MKSAKGKGPLRRAQLNSEVRPLDSLKPAPQNDQLYKPIAWDDPEILDAPLTHASKADSRYVNDKIPIRKLTDLLARARIDALIPWQAIEDSTRPGRPAQRICKSGASHAFRV